MEEVKRAYKGKDIEMLIAASVITESAIANKTFLVSKRANWADPFLQNLKDKIDLTVQTYIGADNAKALRTSTQVLLEIEKNAINDLAEFKVDIEVDYGEEKILLKEILTQLGFKTYHAKARKGDQEALIALLFQFKTNMSPTLQTDIVSKGTGNSLITSIIGYANTLKAADITQESFKGTKQTATATAINEFNACYSLVIGICKISSKYFKDKPDLKSQFSYANVLKTMNNKPSAKNTPPLTPP
jgi:soluble P-type ATPase